MTTRLAPLSGSVSAYMPGVDTQTRSSARTTSKMPGVGNSSVGFKKLSNIGGRSQVRDSIAQARAELLGHSGGHRGGGTESTDTGMFPNMSSARQRQQMGKPAMHSRPSIRMEAANDVNLWGRGAEKIGDRTPMPSRDNNLRQPLSPDKSGSGLLPTLQYAPAPATSDEEGHSHRKKKRKHHKKTHSRRKLKSLAKKRAKARKKKYSAIKLQRWFKSKNRTTAAAVLIQKQLRRVFAVIRVDLVRQARDAGVMVAIRGTIQGKSGWYQDFDGQVYYFAVDEGGTWWEVVAGNRWDKYRQDRSKELQSVPVLVTRVGSKIGDSGIYDEFMEGVDNCVPRKWLCEDGIFRRAVSLGGHWDGSD